MASVPPISDKPLEPPSPPPEPESVKLELPSLIFPSSPLKSPPHLVPRRAVDIQVQRDLSELEATIEAIDKLETGELDILQLALIRARIAQGSIRIQNEVGGTVRQGLLEGSDMIETYPESAVMGAGYLMVESHPRESDLALLAYSITHTVSKVGMRSLATINDGVFLVYKEKTLELLEKQIQTLPQDHPDRKTLEPWLARERAQFLADKKGYFLKVAQEIPCLAHEITSTWALLHVPEAALSLAYVAKAISLTKAGLQLKEEGQSLEKLKAWGDQRTFFRTVDTVKVGIVKSIHEERSEVSQGRFQMTKQALLAVAALKKEEVVQHQETRYQKGKYDFLVDFSVAGTILTVKTLALVGIAVPLIAVIAWSYVALVGLSFIGIAIGLYYLYKTRPALFKELLHFTHVEMTIKRLALAWNEYMLKRKLFYLVELTEKVHDVAVKAKIEPLIQEVKSELKFYENRAQKYRKRIDELQERLEKAEAKDLLPKVTDLDGVIDEIASNMALDVGKYKDLFKQLYGLSLGENTNKEAIKTHIKRFIGTDETLFQKRFTLPQL